MATSDSVNESTAPMQPLIGGALSLSAAAEMMLVASRNMLSASEGGLGSGGRARDSLAEAVEAGLLRALRRQSLLGDEAGEGIIGGLRIPGGSSGSGISGTGYGRTGASITGQGGRAQTYGSIGGAIGYAVGGPVGALIGGMLGGLFGGDDDEEERRRQEEELRRQWLNTPEGFEIQAYLYNLARADLTLSSLIRPKWGSGQGVLPWQNLSRSWQSPPSVVVRMEQGAVQIQAQSAEVGEQAARAFAGELGRTLRLNSVVVPAAGFGGEV